MWLRAKSRAVGTVLSVEPSETMMISHPVRDDPAEFPPCLLRTVPFPFSFAPLVEADGYSRSRNSTASSNMPGSRSSSLYAGTTTLISTSASSIPSSLVLPFSCPLFQVSSQQGNSTGPMVDPSAPTVRYFFSDRVDSLGRGANLRKIAYA